MSDVKLRQVVDRIRHRLSFVPAVYVVVAIFLSQLVLWFDRSLSDESVPEMLATTVDSARSVFTVIAGGLITAITLLLSMMLVTIQLASSQYSPRTLREWLSDRWLQNTIGLALGTTVFSLLALRSARSFGEEGGAVVPHTAVLFAVVAGVASLFAVVRTVDHVTQSLRVGSISERIANDTIRVIVAQGELEAGEVANMVPTGTSRSDVNTSPGLDIDEIPDDAFVIEAPTAGWVQQIDAEAILHTLPEDTSGYIVIPLGGYAMAHSPIMWLKTPKTATEAELDALVEGVLEGIAFGDTRTMQQDVGFGIMQLTDIAVRALSPGINDPGTANDVIVHLGNVLLVLWAQPVGDDTTSVDTRSVTSRKSNHADHLHLALDPVRRYGSADPLVLSTLLRTVSSVRSEAVRRQLPGPLEPLDTMIAAIAASADRMRWSELESLEFDALSRARQE